MDDSILHLVILVAAVTAAGFTQSAMGFGFAIAALSILPYFFDIRLANIVVSLCAIVPLCYTMATHRRYIQPGPVGRCLVGAAIGLPLGLATFAYVDPDLLVRSTGLVILIVVLDGFFHSKQPTSSEKRLRSWSLIAGISSGYLSGSVGIGWPPVVAFATRQSWAPLQFKAFLGAFLLTVATVKVGGLVAMGFVDRHILVLSVIAIPFSYLGAWLGGIVAKRIDAKLFRRLTLSLLAFGALGMVIRGTPTAQDTSDLRAPQSNRQPATERTKLLTEVIGTAGVPPHFIGERP